VSTLSRLHGGLLILARNKKKKGNARNGKHKIPCTAEKHAARRRARFHLALHQHQLPNHLLPQPQLQNLLLPQLQFPQDQLQHQHLLVSTLSLPPGGLLILAINKKNKGNVRNEKPKTQRTAGKRAECARLLQIAIQLTLLNVSTFNLQNIGLVIHVRNKKQVESARKEEKKIQLIAEKRVECAHETVLL